MGFITPEELIAFIGRIIGSRINPELTILIRLRLIIFRESIFRKRLRIIKLSC